MSTFYITLSHSQFTALNPVVPNFAGGGDWAADPQLVPGLLDQNPRGWNGNIAFK